MHAPTALIVGDTDPPAEREEAEYVASLPPNSHGEANPADKDPVPAPFDNTYNSPEHDAFVLKVKYQRSDRYCSRPPLLFHLAAGFALIPIEWRHRYIFLNCIEL